MSVLTDAEVDALHAQRLYLVMDGDGNTAFRDAEPAAVHFANAVRDVDVDALLADPSVDALTAAVDVLEQVAMDLGALELCGRNTLDGKAPEDVLSRVEADLDRLQAALWKQTDYVHHVEDDDGDDGDTRSSVGQ